MIEASSAAWPLTGGTPEAKFFSSTGMIVFPAASWAGAGAAFSAGGSSGTAAAFPGGGTVRAAGSLRAQSTRKRQPERMRMIGRNFNDFMRSKNFYNTRTEGSQTKREPEDRVLRQRAASPPPGRFRSPNFLRCQAQAVSRIVPRSEKRSFHPRTRSAFSFEARRTGGSPSRRGRSSRGTRRPVAFSAAAMTSRTEYPRFVPRLMTSLDPPSRRRRRARTWAEARSAT
ncbi:MAG: hypothetical protein BWX98_02669 [Candidatus Aminicenantes bacterium ADurb.Bin147]|nr:MAG: hypothetical protein BWX98_02669 [Candidatus Aminicenantes bacterium ADurb.Bin147]